MKNVIRKAKRGTGDLAFFGGPPLYQQPLHVGTPNIGNKRHFYARLRDILDRRWLTNNGQYVQELEREIARRVNTQYCVCVSNGTLALELLLRAAGIKGEVIVPAFTFVATAHAVEWVGLRPVFCDVAPGTHHLDTKHAASLIGPHTGAIIAVNTWGIPANIDELEELAHSSGIPLFFDSAHAFGSSYKGKKIGGYGTGEVFSFHATKYINAFEGGAITTNDTELASRIRLLRNFGFAGYDSVIAVGTNAKMTEIAAAMALTNLEAAEAFTTANRTNLHAYQLILAGVPGISFVTNERNSDTCQYLVIEIDESQFGLSRDTTLKLLHAEGVLVRRYFFPGCHLMEPYAKREPRLSLAETERLCDRTLALPTGTVINVRQISVIGNTMRFFHAKHAEIRARLETEPR